MNDSKKSDPKRAPIESLDDEPIIDLVDEVPEGPVDGDLSDLEKNLLNLEQSFDHSLEETGEDLRPLPELPDLNDLDGFDLEEDEAEDLAPSTLPTAVVKKHLPNGMEPELDWLLDEDAPAPAKKAARAAGGTDNGVTEISEFDEQFLEAEEVVDGRPAAKDESDGGDEDETLELLDLDDNDTDNELVWFDDLDKPPDHGAEAQTEPAGVAPLEPADPRLVSSAPAADTSAADLFDAFVESGRSTGADALAGVRAAGNPAGSPDGHAGDRRAEPTPHRGGFATARRGCPDRRSDRRCHGTGDHAHVCRHHRDDHPEVHRKGRLQRD